MKKKLLLGLVAVAVVCVLGVGGVAGTQMMVYDASMAKVYDVSLPAITATGDEAVIARGKHVAESIGACMHCHGADGATGRFDDMGPLAKLQAPNITSGKNGALGSYTDAELARLIRHGVKRDGRSVTFMPSHEISWLPDDDVRAVISYLRTLPPKDTAPARVEVGALGKVLDRFDAVVFDIARRIDHANLPTAPAPEPTALYGSFLALSCTGCHGAGLSGGPIPGAPAELPVPLNLTFDATGMAGWTLEDWNGFLDTGVRKNGEKLHEFMPLGMLTAMNEVERQALFAYLQSLPPKPFGGR